MKLCNVEIHGEPFVGAMTDSGVANITSLGFPSRMNDVIKGGGELLTRIEDALKEKTPHIYREQSLKFLPVTEPAKIICMGYNYKNHAEEGGSSVPDHPVFFSKFADALSAHNEPVPLPAGFSEYDYEAELVIVIGKYAYNVTVDEAQACIYGYTCGNDLSARDAQFLSSQWLSGKALPGFGPIGPCIVTRDSFDPCESNAIQCEVNDVTVQSAYTKDMIFPCIEAVSKASRFFPLHPGDIIFTGTPGGVIHGKPEDKRVWLKPGDIVKVSIDGVGTLITPLVKA